MLYKYGFEMCKTDLKNTHPFIEKFCNSWGYSKEGYPGCMLSKDVCNKIYPKNYQWTKHPRKEKVWEVCQSLKAA